MRGTLVISDSQWNSFKTIAAVMKNYFLLDPEAQGNLTGYYFVLTNLKPLYLYPEDFRRHLHCFNQPS